MARTDNDTWDLASSVGMTATMVAAARAVATRAANPVIDDPYAAPLVQAVGIDFFARLATGELSPADLDSGDTPIGIGQFIDGMAARTRFFDDFFADAADAGIRQAVILASGLDARGYRLNWPQGTVLFEIDQPEVIAFKTRRMAELGAGPTAELHTIGMDLRQDWPAALAEAGFDACRPTAWIAEGLLGYLPPEGQDRLLDQITQLSAPGSRVGAEGVVQQSDLDTDAVREHMQVRADQWRAHGFDLDFADLVFVGDRADVTAYLQALGWTTTSLSTNELLVKYGFMPLEPGEGFVSIDYVSARR